MKYSLLYKSCICLLAMVFTFSVKAQQKVPDVSRFSKAPIAPEGNGRARMAAKAAGSQPRRTPLDSFGKAPVKAGGTANASPARMAARTAVVPANVTLPSSVKAVEPTAQKNTSPAIPAAIQEQLNMKPEADPVKKTDAPAKKKETPAKKGIAVKAAALS